MDKRSARLRFGDPFFVPMPGSAEDGNAFFRFAILVALTIAVVGLVHRIAAAMQLLKRAWPICALFVWLLITSRWSAYPDLSVRRTVAYVFIFAISVSLAVSFERAMDFQRPLFKGLVLVFLANIISSHMVAPIDAEMGVNGIYAQKNGAGALALYVIIVATSAVMLYRHKLMKLFSVGVAILAWAFLISTHAKTSIATAGVLSAGLPLLSYLLSRQTPHKVIATGACAFLLGMFLLSVQLLDITGEQLGQAVFSDLTFTNRTYIWDALYPEIARHPWTGTGFGSFWGTGQALNPITNARPDAFFMTASVINEAHNGYIDIALQAGYVGLTLTVLIITRAGWRFCSVIAAPQARREDRIACTMLLGLVVALAVANFTESEIFSPSNPIGYLFVVIAVQAERWRSALRRD